MRLRNVKNAFNIIEENRDICIDDPTLYKGNWKSLSSKDNNSKIYLEVGCGKGKFLNSMAKENTDILFIGIEMMSSVICRAITKVKESKTPNVKLLNKDCEHILDYFSLHEIDKIFINFPDPWPKARHEKRRLTSPRLLDKYKIILKEDGIIRLKTDNYDLYNYSLETIIPLLKDGYKYGEVDYNIPIVETEFETKFRMNGNPIYYIEGSFK